MILTHYGKHLFLERMNNWRERRGEAFLVIDIDIINRFLFCFFSRLEIQSAAVVVVMPPVPSPTPPATFFSIEMYLC